MPQDKLPFKIVEGVLDDGQRFSQLNIQDFAKDAYVLMFFFPLGSIEDLMFAKNLSKNLDVDCKVIGVTKGSPEAIIRWIHDDNMAEGLTIISDEDEDSLMGVARGFGFQSRLAWWRWIHAI